MKHDFEPLEIPVLSIQQPIGEFFLAAMDARDLVRISYADVRRLVTSERDVERYLGIQRPLSASRVREIRQYIRSPDASFPTAVILAVDEDCVELVEGKYSTKLRLQPTEQEHSPNKPAAMQRIARVLDGQHRIAAFIDVDGDFDESIGREFQINVALFVGIDLSEQANIFATVNLAQTKVNKNLVYDLMELANTPSPHKTCHNVAIMLDQEPSSPLFQRIKRLGTATPGRAKEPLTQAGFVESLVRFISPNPLDDRNQLLEGKRLAKANDEELGSFPFRNLFIEGKELDIAEILFNYFSAVKRKWPQSWDSTAVAGNLLPKSNAFKALLKYLKEDVYKDAVNGQYGKIPTIRRFETYFADLDLRDEDFTKKNFVPGSGGQSVFLKMLRRQLRRNDLLEI